MGALGDALGGGGKRKRVVGRGGGSGEWMESGWMNGGGIGAGGDGGGGGF